MKIKLKLIINLIIFFSVTFQVNGAWSLPNFVCDFYIAMDVICSTSSIFNLVAISIDRWVCTTRTIFLIKILNGKQQSLLNERVKGHNYLCVVNKKVAAWQNDRNPLRSESIHNENSTLTLNYLRRSSRIWIARIPGVIFVFLESKTTTNNKKSIILVLLFSHKPVFWVDVNGKPTTFTYCSFCSFSL